MASRYVNNLRVDYDFFYVYIGLFNIYCRFSKFFYNLV